MRLVGAEVHLLDSSGSILHVAANSGKSVRTRDMDLSSEEQEKRSLSKRFQNGWVAYADWFNNGNSPISSFWTLFAVPHEPTTKSSQTIFLFPSIEPAGGNAILQPVLQWGGSAAGGGQYWAVATWYIVDNNVYHTTPVRVNVGRELTGRIALKSRAANGTSFSYESEFTNIGGTTLKATSPDELVWATETLEVYGVQNKTDYPASKTVFNGIMLQTQNGRFPNIRWATSNDPADGVSAVVNRQGSLGAAVTITY